jgi:hypothetical protein
VELCNNNRANIYFGSSNKVLVHAYGPRTHDSFTLRSSDVEALSLLLLFRGRTELECGSGDMQHVER